MIYYPQTHKMAETWLQKSDTHVAYIERLNNNNKKKKYLNASPATYAWKVYTLHIHFHI